MLALAASLLLMGSPAQAAEGGHVATSTRAQIDLPDARGDRTAQRGALLDYWTPERMRAVETASDDARTRQAEPTNDTVGKIFFNHPDGTPDVCTGTAVDTDAETLVMTAGHCLEEPPGGGWMKNIVFVPGYEDGDAPLGMFPAWDIATDSLWGSEGDEEHDYGMIVTYDNGADEHVVDAAGGFGVVAGRGATNDVTIIGYSAEAPYDGEHQEYCTDITEPTTPPQNLLHAHCPNMVGGSSGGPWLIEYSAGDQLGLIYGLNTLIDGQGFVASPRFDQRTLDFVSLMDQVAAARP